MTTLRLSALAAAGAAPLVAAAEADQPAPAAASEPAVAGPVAGDVTARLPRIDAADSLALYLQNRFALSEALAVNPGLRVEDYRQSRENLRAVAPAVGYVETDNTEVMPGVGITWQFNPGMQVFGGIYPAFSPALNGGATLHQSIYVGPERSIDIGARYRF